MSQDPSSPFPDLTPDEARQVDAICRVFEASWSAGCRPQLEEALPQDPGPLRNVLVFELLALELELRRSSGETPEATEYLSRLPEHAVEVFRAFGEERPPPTTTVPMGATAPAIVLKQGDVSIVGDYELQAEVARGGMGVVYRARQISLNRTVALKMILSGRHASEQEIRRFRLEAEAAARLDHPGIVPIYETGQLLDHPFFSMGFVEGTSLARKIAAGPIPARDAAMVVREVAQAVQYAHDRGVIHRDLKPQNILVDAQGRPRITDFGLAKQVQSDDGLTIPGSVLGTPSYMPPEQAQGDPQSVGPWSDIYSLGGVLYCLLTGRAPFQGATALETLAQVVELDPVAPRVLNPATSRDLETICLKCLQKDRRRRYASARELASDLDRWLVGEPILARPAGRIERTWRWCRRNPRVASLTALLFTTLAVVAVAATWASFVLRDQATREARANQKAQAAASLAEQEQAIAEAKEQESRTRLVVQLVSNGSRPLAEGDVLAALPWYAEALAVDHDHPVRGPIHRMRLGAALRAAPPLARLAFAPHSTFLPPSLAPDGRTFLGAETKLVTRLDVLAGKFSESHFSVPQSSKGFCISRDGRLAAWAVLETAGKDRTRTEIHVWDVSGNRPARPPMVLQEPVDKLAFSPDGQRLASTGPRGPLRIWDLSTGRELVPAIPIGLEVRYQFLFSPDGRWLAFDMRTEGSRPEYFVQLIEIEGGRTKSQRLSHAYERLGWLGFSLDGSRLATLTWVGGLDIPVLNRSSGTNFDALMNGVENGLVRVWDTSSGALLCGPLRHFNGPRGQVLSAAISPDGYRIATGGVAEARVWDVKSSVMVGPPMELGGPIADLVFSPDGLFVAACGAGIARGYDAYTVAPVTPRLRQASEIHRVGYSADGRLLLTSSGLEARAWDLTSSGRVVGRAFPGLWSSPDARLTASYASWSTNSGPRHRQTTRRGLKVYQRSTGKDAVPPIALGRVRVDHVALSADGHRLSAVINQNNQLSVRTWDLASGKEVGKPLTTDVAPVGVALSPGGHRIAIAVGAGYKHPTGVRLGSPDSGKLLALPIDKNRTVVSVLFSPVGDRLLTVQDGVARLWNSSGLSVGSGMATGQPPSQFNVRLNRLYGVDFVRCAAFTSDGKSLALSLGNPLIYFLDAETGVVIPDSRITNRAGVTLLAISGDGRRLIAGLENKTAQVWDLQTKRALGPPLLPSVPDASYTVRGEDRVALTAVDLSSDGQVALVAGGALVQLFASETGMAIGTPLRASGSVHRALLSEHWHVVALIGNEGGREWDAAPDNRSLDKLRALTAVLSGHRIEPDGGEANLSADQLVQAWDTLHGQEPELSVEPAEPAVDRHRRLTWESLSHGRLFAALFHLNAQIAAEPKDADLLCNLLAERGDVEARLGRYAEASASLEGALAHVPKDPHALRRMSFGAMIHSTWISRAVLEARLGHVATYQEACQAVLKLAAGFWQSQHRVEAIQALGLRPEGVAAAEQLVLRAKGSSLGIAPRSAVFGARALAEYRAGHLESARTWARESIAEYALELKRSPFQTIRATRPPSVVARGEDVTPATPGGTPREWLLLALIEQRLGRLDAARAWREKGVQWLDRAAHDLNDPSLAGVLGYNASQQLTPRLPWSGFEFRSVVNPASARGLSQSLPSWRDLLEVQILREEVDSLLEKPRSDDSNDGLASP